jgi:hypothetical protein
MIIETLAGWGLNKLKDLVFKKGEDFVNDKLGINLTELISKGEEGKRALQALELEKEKEINSLLKSVDEETTKRWQSDNLAGGLANIIRPATLIYLMFVFTLFAIMGACGVNVPTIYAESIRDMLYIAIPAYFGLRSLIDKRVNK